MPFTNTLQPLLYAEWIWNHRRRRWCATHECHPQCGRTDWVCVYVSCSDAVLAETYATTRTRHANINILSFQLLFTSRAIKNAVDCFKCFTSFYGRCLCHAPVLSYHFRWYMYMVLPVTLNILAALHSDSAITIYPVQSIDYLWKF